MTERILLIFWAAWLLLVFVAACRVFGFLIARRQQDRLWGNVARNQQRVALIVPVKGFDLLSTPRFFDAIFGQNYREYRVIVCFESWEDPVVLWLCEHLELDSDNPVWTHPDLESGLLSITLVCAGLSVNEGQKVHNQIAAFRDLTGEDAVIAFADADIQCGPEWLAKLVAPINQGTHPLSTTYRWLVPKRPTLPNQLVSVINGSITTQGGNELTNILWGGSMAVSREVFDSLDVPTLLSGSLNDDLRLSKAARQAGNRIAFVRSLVLPTVVDFGWRGFFEFVRRQYTQVKFFSPILYTGTNLVLGFYVLGALSIAAALVYGYFFAWIPVAAAYVIDQFRSLARQQVYLSLFPDNTIRQKLFSASWLEHMLTPFWMVLHWLLLAATWTQKRITWAGVRYQIVSKSETRVLHRTEAVSQLPAGAPGLALISALHDRKRDVAITPLPEAVTFTALAEEAPEVVPAHREPVSEATETATSSGATATHPTISHPGAPSAILPLTTTFHHRDLLYRKPDRAKDRGCLTGAEAVLAKSRVVPHSLFPCSIAVATTPSPQKQAVPQPNSLGFQTHPSCPVLSNAERRLAKTRSEGASPARIPEISPDKARGTILSRAESLAIKTRVRRGSPFPAGSATTPPENFPGGSASFAGQSDWRKSSVARPEEAATNFSDWAPRSHAAHRAVPGAASNSSPRSGRSSLSSRTNLRARPSGQEIYPRPVSPHPSGRK